MIANNSNNGMNENVNTEDEKLLILPLNDENSRKITQIISNDTARNILEAIASEPLSTSEIAEKLGIPLSTVQYNLDKLNDAGLVKVARTKYSEKMKGPIGEVTRSIPEKGGGVPAPIPASTPIAAPERALDVTLGFDIFAHPGLWFLFGSLFVILAVVLIEYLGRKKERKD